MKLRISPILSATSDAPTTGTPTAPPIDPRVLLRVQNTSNGDPTIGGVAGSLAASAASATLPKTQNVIANAPTVGRVKPTYSNHDPSDLFDFKDSGGIYTGKYPLSHAETAINAAKVVGVDPHELLALYMRESNLGTKKGVRSPFQGGLEELDKPYQDKYYALQKQNPNIDPNALVAAVDLMAHNDRAKSWGKDSSDAERLQAYNGYGKVTSRDFGGAKKAYGMEIPEGGLDMGKLLLYGKSLVKLKNDLKNNPQIAKLINK